jgi:putative transposase
LGISRNALYYSPVGESALNLEIMRKIDEQYLKTPFYGVRRMAVFLQNEGYPVNEKRVRRLMRLMNLTALYPKPNLSIPDGSHKIYPYLLRNQTINEVNQVWSTDITYIPMTKGFLYLTAVIDWYSRYVLSWELSNSLETAFCLRAMETAFQLGKPLVFNTDQGSQYTSLEFTDFLETRQVQISMDGKGRALDNVFIERLWRSVKYECVYLNAFEDGQSLYRALEAYFKFYNCERPHQSLNYHTPEKIFLSKRKIYST